ncbi:integrase catalytic domain-containing protein [Trichonephila clavipes]|nr:integrase catalytic domain-containing protein [Trichonephila clavipes]
MHGPQWLRTTENNWPKSLNCDFSSTDPCESEEQVFTFACVQVTAPLPALRVEQSAPFSVVGIDFGGPLYTKDENKHYIVLFTCAVTRALHLELVNNLTTETFLLALRRFISRRGLCSKILTDNAKTFKKSELELKNLWKIISDPTVKAFYASHKIYWQFIIERAPWWGGFYERLIRTVKLALQKTVGRATLFRDELETLLIEIEGVLNSRPLTYIFSEFNEPEPLTPSHMILGRRVNSLPPV